MRPNDTLTGIVNLGALAAYCAVHVSVIVLLAIKRRSGRWILHGLFPVIGIVIIATVASQFSRPAMALGASWFAAGLVYYGGLKIWKRSAAAAQIPA